MRRRPLWAAALAVALLVLQRAAVVAPHSRDGGSVGAEAAAAAALGGAGGPGVGGAAEAELPQSPYHVLFMSHSLRGHVEPLLRLAEEVRSRGHRVSFATNDDMKDRVLLATLGDGGLEFVSAGEFPIAQDDLHAQLASVSQQGSRFRGIFALFNEVYKSLILPLYTGVTDHIIVTKQSRKGLASWSSKSSPSFSSSSFSALPSGGGSGSGGASSSATGSGTGRQKRRGPGVGQMPDLIVSDASTFASVVLARKLNVTYILNSPTFLFDLEPRASYIPSWGTGFPSNMTLWDRCVNVIFPRLMSVALTPFFIHLNRLCWDEGLPQFHSHAQVFAAARILVNTVPGIELPTYIHPRVEHTGPLLPRRVYTRYFPELAQEMEHSSSLHFDRAQQKQAAAASKLGGRLGHEAKRVELASSNASDPRSVPPLIDGWLHGKAYGGLASDLVSPSFCGTVVLTLGHMNRMDDAQLRVVLEALVHTGTTTGCLRRTLWLLPWSQRRIVEAPAIADVLASGSMDGEELIRTHELGGDAHLDVFAHEAVTLVVSHCGASVAQEALVFGKPLVCIPFHSDQYDVAARLLELGVAQQLLREELSAKEARRVIDETAGPSSAYAKAAQQFGALVRSRGGTYRAADVIDSTLESGVAHLQTPEDVFPWHRRHMLDAMLVLIAVLTVYAMLVYAVFAACAQALRRFRRARVRKPKARPPSELDLSSMSMSMAMAVASNAAAVAAASKSSTPASSLSTSSSSSSSGMTSTSHQRSVAPGGPPVVVGVTSTSGGSGSGGGSATSAAGGAAGGGSRVRTEGSAAVASTSGSPGDKKHGST